jgi:putative methionine-R-sulfoxide reductase with GAF domain
MSRTDDAIAEIERAIETNPDADDVLRATLDTLHRTAGYPWAGILFVEGDDLVLGPHAGTHADAAVATAVPVTWDGDRIAELRVDDAPEEDRIFLERVVALVAGHCLVGWDTGGESWDP